MPRLQVILVIHKSECLEIPILTRKQLEPYKHAQPWVRSELVRRPHAVAQPSLLPRADAASALRLLQLLDLFQLHNSSRRAAIGQGRAL